MRSTVQSMAATSRLPSRSGHISCWHMRKEYDFSRGKRGPAIKSPGKTRITIMIDDDVIEGFRAKAETAGRGYQTLMNEILRAALTEEDRPLTAKVLRKILREELRAP